MDTLFNKGPAILFIKVFHCRFFTKDHMNIFRIVYIQNTCEWLLLLYIYIALPQNLSFRGSQSIFNKVETTTFKI